MRKFKIGLALGGGGARGLAHIGVLKVLERNGLAPDFIAGTSMGAIIGGMYCCGMPAEEIEKKTAEFLAAEIYQRLKFDKMSSPESKNILTEIFGKIKEKAIFYLSGIKTAFLEKSAIDDMIAFFLPDVDFKDLKIPFACVAVDILSGKEVIFEKGPIWEAVSSSISIPGVMPPVKYEGSVLVDGGAAELVPVEVAKRAGCDFTIGVDVSESLPLLSEQKLKSAFDIMQRTGEVSLSVLRQIQIKGADFLLTPSVKNVKWFEIKKYRECILAGENEAMGKSERLKTAVRNKKIKTFLGRMFSVDKTKKIS